MPSKPELICGNIKSNVKMFLDDRLIDPEYEAFCSHVENCPECRKYVRSFSCLSNQIWKLSEVAVPSDLSSTILFKLKQPGSAAMVQPSSFSKKTILGAILIIIGFFAVFGAVKFFKSPESSTSLQEGSTQAQPSDAQVRSAVNEEQHLTGTALQQETVSDKEAEYLYNQLQVMAQSLETISQSKADDETKTKEEVSVSQQPVESVEPNETMAPSTATPSIHWHFPYRNQSEVKQLIDTIRLLEIKPDFESSSAVVFKATGNQLKVLSEGISFTSKIQMTFPDAIDAGSSAQQVLPVSISFKKMDSSIPEYSSMDAKKQNDVFVSLEQKRLKSDYGWDWHILLIPSQRNALFDILSDTGVRIMYESKETVIFSTPSALTRQIAEKIRGTGGIFVDFGKFTFDDDLTLRGTTEVMMYITEK